MNCRPSLPISTAASMVGAMTERLSADDIVDLARDNLRSPALIAMPPTRSSSRKTTLRSESAVQIDDKAADMRIHLISGWISRADYGAIECR